MKSYPKANRQVLVSRLENAIANYDGSDESGVRAVEAQRRLMKFDRNHRLFGHGIYRPTFPKGTRVCGRLPYEFKGCWVFIPNTGVFAG